MGTGHGPQARCPHRCKFRRRDADDHPTDHRPISDRSPACEVRPVTETPNPHIVDADTLTGEMRPIRRCVISVGPNLGDRLAKLQGALDSLSDTPDGGVTEVSPVYETEPVEAPEGSGAFLNAVSLLD